MAGTSPLDPVALLTDEAKATLTFFRVPEAAQPYLGQQAIRDISNPELRKELQRTIQEDLFADYDPEAEAPKELQAARQEAIDNLTTFAKEQATLLTAMAENPVAWFVLRARLVQLSQQIDAQMAAEGGHAG
jgi:hypothetical protein